MDGLALVLFLGILNIPPFLFPIHFLSWVGRLDSLGNDTPLTFYTLLLR
jgi:hypothetical protein